MNPVGVDVPVAMRTPTMMLTVAILADSVGSRKKKVLLIKIQY